MNSTNIRSRISTTAAEALEDRIAPATLVGLTSRDFLVTFDSAAPEKILSAVKITGLDAGDDVRSIDARPASGVIYGLTAANKLYTLNPYTGAATAVTSGTAAFGLDGKNVGIDFNPTVDRLRIVTDADLNFRINPINGAIVDGDGVEAGTQPDIALAYDSADVNQGRSPTLGAVAYENNFQGATLTTLYGIDTARNTLVRIGGVDGTPSPNGGLVFTIGSLGVNPGPRVGFDIAADDTAFATMQVGPRTILFQIDLTTGEATPVGKVAKGTIKLDAITVLPHEEIVVGVTTTNKLVTFRASDPGTMLSSLPLTGLNAGETIAGIDFRPVTGELFALTSSNRVVYIDTHNGRVVPVNSGITTTPQFLAGSPAGFDFNPTVDRLRLVNTANDNLRYNPNTHVPVDSDANSANGTTPDADLAYIATDANVGIDPNITGVAYDRNDNNGATATTLFAIDSTLNTLVRQGAVDGNAADVAGGGSPNGGLLTTLGSLGVDTTDLVGFDISDNGQNGVGVALASMQLNGESLSRLFAINLTAGLSNQPLGSATSIGTIAAGDALTAMAIAPASIQLAAVQTIVKEKAGTFAVIDITRTGGANVAVSVLFNTSDGTALAGADYTAVTGLMVDFARGETLKRVMIPIVGDRLVENDEFFRVALQPVATTSTTVTSTIAALVTIQGKPLVL